jgi:uncharacterized lipoprotein YddW (UPF0748 family)
MKKILLLLALVLAAHVQAQVKREFRGAWIQCVNGQFQGLSTQQMQQTLTYQLNELQKDGVNAIIFQVRPECDALYQSNIEPWSRFLTGRQGKAPSPFWDPLQWMINECHKRGMELHAWINPYRAKTKGTTALASSHIGVTHPERCFRYDDQLILNPGDPENRFYICDVVADIVSRYDVDGLHIDDYFYPYPVAGQTIPDDAQYRQYSNGIKDRGDWRRYNVSLFVKQLYETVHRVKPWVKVGISPFGIYRNKKSDPMGSDTNGLQNYDDLYAEVLLWINNGWLDYCVPQLYWEIGHKAADYDRNGLHAEGDQDSRGNRDRGSESGHTFHEMAESPCDQKSEHALVRGDAGKHLLDLLHRAGLKTEIISKQRRDYDKADRPQRIEGSFERRSEHEDRIELPDRDRFDRCDDNSNNAGFVTRHF